MNDNSSDNPTHELKRLDDRLERMYDILQCLDRELEDQDESIQLGLLSFIIPVKDEEATLVELYRGIAANIPDGYEHEVFLVDDGSEDRSWSAIQQLAEENQGRVRGIRFRHNVGKATALNLGFRLARGEIVFTMDADLQDDPQEIPRFLNKLREGFDIVSGWKRVRHDPWHKVLPSRVFNMMLSRAGRVKLHDHNCGFKCYRAEVVKRVELHGELHRMIPSLAAMNGFRSAEIEVQHHPRREGQSKYGLERLFRGFSDMLTVGFLRRFRQRPSHCFNAVSFLYLVVSGGLCLLSAYSGFHTMRGMLTALTGVVFGGLAIAVFLAGLISELLIRGPLRMNEEIPVVEDTQWNVPAAEGLWSNREESDERQVPIALPDGRVQIGDEAIEYTITGQRG